MVALTLREIGPIEALRAPGASRDALARLLPPFEPGELLGASVLRRLGDGSFTVELSGQLMRMALPEGTRPGDRLTLAFVGDLPRLTFLLKATQAAAEPVPQLSAIGRQVAALMGQAMTASAAQPAAPPVSALAPVSASVSAPALAALLAGPPTDAAPLAQALGKTLAQSGLFYEAHQAQWVGGTLALTQLRQEPQAQLQAAPAHRLTAPSAFDPPVAANATVIDAGMRAPAALQEALIHPASLPLVQQQLGTLESGRVALLLEIWPRQWMQWDIEEQAPGDGAEPHAPSEWRTRLRLDLPTLGKIDASLTLRADGMHILIEAADSDSAVLMAGQRTALRQALEDAGLPASVIAIGALENPSSSPHPASSLHPSFPLHPSSPSFPSDPSSSPHPSSRRRPGSSGDLGSMSSAATSGLRPSPQ